ncbi:helix-turn-helix domain-containing protein [Mycolicibacterium moriokaense]|nr:helix-turn-helix transcriptional regulator [Mycolicibacterium moriokaense]
MVLAITTLLLAGQPTPNARSSRRGVSHTLALFATGFVVLAFAAYFFGSVAATQPPSGNRPLANTLIIIGETNEAMTPAGAFPDAEATSGAREACKMAWIQFMPASGMIALGASLLVAGIGLMLTHHAANNPAPNKQLTTLGNILSGLALAGTTTLLMYNALVFVEVMQEELEVPPWAHAKFFVWFFGTVLIVAIVAIVVRKTFPMSYVKRSKFPKLKFARRHNETDQFWAEVLNPRYRIVETLAVLTALYLIAVLVFSWALSRWEFVFLSHWRITDRVQLWDSIFLGLYVPGLLNIILAFSMPGVYNGTENLWHGRRLRTVFDRGKRRRIRDVRQGEDAITEVGSLRSYEVLDVREVTGGDYWLHLKPIIRGRAVADKRHLAQTSKIYSPAYHVFIHKLVGIDGGSDDEQSLSEMTREFGVRIRGHRKALRLREGEVASRCGIRTGEYCRLESGQRNVSLETVVKLAEVFEVNVEDLVEELPSPNPD